MSKKPAQARRCDKTYISLPPSSRCGPTVWADSGLSESEVVAWSGVGNLTTEVGSGKSSTPPTGKNCYTSGCGDDVIRCEMICTHASNLGERKAYGGHLQCRLEKW